MPVPQCIHCEQRNAATELDLCSECDAVHTIRWLYRRGPHWSPEREERLRHYAQLAKQQLPLFS